MSKEIKHLLKPRYKVINDYPGGIYKVGDLVEPHAYYGFDIFPYPHKYPHLFKSMDWWEDRGVEDMPQYIKPKISPEYVFKVSRFNLGLVEYIGTDGKLKLDKASVFFPATEQEYQTFINKEK